MAVSSGPSGTSSQRQVGDAEEEVAQRGVGRGGLGFEAGDLVLLVGDEGAEALELGLVAAGLGGADRLAGGVALGERGLGGGDAGAAGLVEGEDLGRGGRQAAAGEGGVEGVGVVADLADVVHFGLESVRGGLWRTRGGKERNFGVWNRYGNGMESDVCFASERHGVGEVLEHGGAGAQGRVLGGGELGEEVGEDAGAAEHAGDGEGDVGDALDLGGGDRDREDRALVAGDGGGDPGEAGADAVPGGALALDDGVGGAADAGVDLGADARRSSGAPTWAAKEASGTPPARAEDQARTSLSPCSPRT